MPLRPAAAVAARVGAPVQVLHVLDGAIPRGVLQSGGAEEVEEVTAAWSAADGLCARVAAGDLIVIGSRELRGEPLTGKRERGRRSQSAGVSADHPAGRSEPHRREPPGK